MKPIRLELKEFGPYKHEIVEWDKIINEPIFLITGKTGSGKSTLFDAFVYALYNKTTSGKDIASLRTKTADDKTRTTVIFDFELKNKLYRVERTLAYTKKGNKNQTSGKVALTEIVDNNENVLATKEQDVKEKIEQIIGLDDKQFCQLIILPQGKFKDFLLSKSSEKKETLRSLFNTFFYQKFIDKLSAYAKEQDNDYKLKERELITKFDQFIFDEKLDKFEFLKEENFENVNIQINNQGNIISEKENVLTNLNKELENLREEHAKITKLNDKFVEFDELKEKYEEIIKEENNIIEIQNIIKKLEELEKNIDRISEYNKLITKENELVKKKEDLEKDFEDYSNKRDSNVKLGEQLEVEKKEIEVIKNKLAEVKYFYDNISAFELAFKEKKECETKLKEFDKNKLELSKYKENILKLEQSNKQELEKSESLKTNISKIDLSIVKKEVEVEKLEEYKNDKSSLEKNKVELEAKIDKLNLLRQKQSDLKNKVEELEKNKEKEILNTFLEKLHDGDNCPLCQQKIIHVPEVIDVKHEEDTLINKEYEDTNKEIIRLETIISNEQDDYKKLQLQLNEQEKVINFDSESELESIKKEKDENEKLLRVSQKAIEENQIQLDKLNSKVIELEKIIESEGDLKEKLSLANAKIEEYNKKVQQDIIDFKEYYKGQEQQVTEFNNNFEKYTEEKSQLQLKEKELEIDIKNNKERIISINSDLEELLDKFNNSKLKEYYSDFKEAHEALEDLKDLKDYKEKVDAYNLAKKSLTNNIKKLEKELSKEVKPNLEEIKERVQLQEEKVSDFGKQLAVQKNTYNTNKELYSELYNEFKVWESNIKEVREIITLSNVLSGKTESKKSLETYVQGYYLDLILEAGSKRLLQMSNDRYRFERRIEKAKGGGLQGLDIEIYDVYLNSNRIVNSLSGGELFLASLSLALGLAEVIQNESGGISLETIFIDEGFGSLDSETLDMAITTLIDLQSYGRNIGIISHVSELKDRIRSKVEVYSENNYAKVRITGV
ncbi:AAA family ATPase [Gemella sanguinis]|uniref:AAA family ATPase n=1 Tax=Gemella sanguinis TaxID=84135 RepID=UPI0004E198A7|nr:AAA family ATPase [Gemella sanguinis]NKZ25522.1 AAA family ATPase [Gemella sanguinis]